MTVFSYDLAIGTLGTTGSGLTTSIRLKGPASGLDTAAANLTAGGESPNGTIVTWIGLPGLTNRVGEVWTINAMGKIAVNGVTDPLTANVVELAYVNHVLWQLNTWGDWYSKARASDPWWGPTKVSPLPSKALLGGGGVGRNASRAVLTSIFTPGHPFSKDFSGQFET